MLRFVQAWDWRPLFAAWHPVTPCLGAHAYLGLRMHITVTCLQSLTPPLLKSLLAISPFVSGQHGDQGSGYSGVGVLFSFLFLQTDGLGLLLLSGELEVVPSATFTPGAHQSFLQLFWSSSSLLSPPVFILIMW